MNRGKTVVAGDVDGAARRLLSALSHALDEQPRALTHRFGVVNVSWVALEALGTIRGPRALEALFAGGYLRRHPRYPEIGRLTPAGMRLLAPVAAA